MIKNTFILPSILRRTLNKRLLFIVNNNNKYSLKKQNKNEKCHIKNNNSINKSLTLNNKFQFSTAIPK